MKSTTPSKFPHESGAVFNYIETHRPVVIKSRDHHDIIMVLASDYEDMVIENDRLKEYLRGMIFLYKEAKGVPFSPSESSKFEHFRVSNADCYLAGLSKPPANCCIQTNS